MLCSKRKTKQVFILFILTILNAIIFSGCERSFKFPEESDFSLTATVSNNFLKAGNELTVTAIFKNNKADDYNVASTASFSKSGLIQINLFEINEEEGFFVGSEPHIKLKAKEEIEEVSKFIVDKPGKYKVVVSSIFYIIDPNTNEKRMYIIKANKTIIYKLQK